MINLHKRMLPTQRESNPQPPDHQSDAHPTEPPRLAPLNFESRGNFALFSYLCTPNVQQHTRLLSFRVQGILNFRGTNLFVEGEWECGVFVVQPTDFSVGRQGFFFFFFFFLVGHQWKKMSSSPSSYLLKSLVEIL